MKRCLVLCILRSFMVIRWHGHVARMSPNIPAHQALRLQVETSLGRRPDRDWVRSSGRPATAGSTNSARTISAHLLTYGEQPSSVVTLERRYGPRRLRDDDDDDDGHSRSSQLVPIESQYVIVHVTISLTK